MIELKKGYGIHNKPVRITIDDNDMPVALVSLGNRKVTQISLSDIGILKDHSFYGHQRKDGKLVAKSSTTGALLHRLILDPAREHHIDHIYADPLDNRRGSIRECTPIQNELWKRTAREPDTGLYGVKTYRDRYHWHDNESGTWRICDCPLDGAELRDESYREYYQLSEEPFEPWHTFNFIGWNNYNDDDCIFDHDEWLEGQISESIKAGLEIMNDNEWSIEDDK